ncbi:MAG: hypothetical protein NTW96_10685 [Planctomycetia bacterium]|nr:hypothetical protein [Planctomycetia bacterium]
MSIAESRPGAARVKRRWFQYSLRTLFVFVLVCAIPCSWLAVRMKSARRQACAAEAIAELRGGLFYDYQMESSICIPEGDPSAPAWLRLLLGEYVFVDVVGVGLLGDHVTNDDLVHLREFPKLEFFMLQSPNFNDDGLDYLSGLPHLRYLEIHETRVTADGIERLRQTLPGECTINWDGKTRK